MTISLVLILVAFLCFMAAAINVRSPLNLVALGLALWVLTILIGGR